MKQLLYLIFLFIGTLGLKARFDNYQVLRLIPENEEQLQALRELELTGQYDFWTLSGTVNRSTDILVPPHKIADFEEFVEANNITEEYLIENVQTLIDEVSFRVAPRCRDMSWNSYHSLEEIYSWMDDVVKEYPAAKKVFVGKSYQGRRIKALEISFQDNATGIFIESGMHAREWVTPAATSWMVKQILDSPADSVFRNFSYYYIPVFNPDGYAYSWTHNRLWKKTRTPYKVGKITCYGADPDRNWDFRWNEIKECDNPCSENYAGPFAFSEVEMRAIGSYLKNIGRSRYIDIYLSFHSYSQVLVYPWDHQREPAAHRDIWQRIGEAAVEDLRNVHGTDFEVGNSGEFFYSSTGGSSEWYYNLYNATIAYTFELRDKGNYGFLIPPEEIIPIGEEILPSLERILLEYQELHIVNPKLL